MTVGSTAFALGPTVASVLAIDNRPDTIAEALRLSREVGVDNVSFTLGNVYALPLADGPSRWSPAATPCTASPSRSRPSRRWRGS